LKTVGLEFGEEERRKLEEERLSAEETAQMQEELEQSAQMDEMAMPQQAGAAPPPGGDPAAAGQMPQMQGMPGAMPGGGMPPVDPAAAPGPMGQPMGPTGAAQGFGAAMGTQPTDTPEALQQKADTFAQQLMAMPESQKDSALIQLKKEDSVLHALVKSQLEEMKRDAQLRGGEMVMAQEYGKQAAMLQASLGSPRTRVIELD
jgi:hypothetical protein